MAFSAASIGAGGSSSSITTMVVINISGQRFSTPIGSLNVEPESYLAHLVREHLKRQSSSCDNNNNRGSVQFPPTAAAAATRSSTTTIQNPNQVLCPGEIFLCRDPSVFQYVLNYLRNGCKAVMPTIADHETLQRLMKEAEFYQLHGLVPLVWRTMRGIPLILPPLQIDQEVCWNPGTFSLYWRSVAAMSRCYEPRRAHYQVIGLMKSMYQLTNGSSWWCYDVRCPACSSFDFAPVDDDGIDFNDQTAESSTKTAMRSSRGHVRRLCNGGMCALVDWAGGSGVEQRAGWRFHIPVSALLPVAVASMI